MRFARFEPGSARWPLIALATLLISAIVDDVRSFSGQEQTDDLTLVVARRVG